MKRALVLALVLAAACSHSPAKPASPTAAPRREAQPAASGASAADVLATPGDLSTPAFSPAEPPPAQDPFAALRAQVDDLLRVQAEALWRAWTRGERVDLAATYQGRDDIFSAGSVRRVGDAAQQARGDEQRALQLLYGYLAGEHLARETRDAAARLARARDAATISWSGRNVPADGVPGRLAVEPDAGRRAELYRLQARAAASWSPRAAEHAAALDRAARALGHESALALGVALRGGTREELAAFADRVLTETDAAYQEVMSSVSRAELGRPFSELRAADIPRLFHAVQDPRVFPASRLLPDVRALFSGLRLDLESRPGAVLDLAARPNKDPRALALPVSVPGDVRLSAVPGGGLSDLRALLHEMALASWYAHIESPRLEFRRLGNTTGETWALLFEDLAGDPRWLVERTGDTEDHLAPLVRVAAARRLHVTREAAARLLLELRRPADAADAAGAAKAATAVLERAFAHPVSEDEVALALAERDPLLHSVVALRASVLAVQGERFFQAGAGRDWWKDARVGAFLRRSFAEGSRANADALSAAFGSRALDPSAVAVRARERVRWADTR